MATRAMSINDLQKQIDDLIEAMKLQSQKTQEAEERIAALRTASETSSIVSPLAVAPSAPANCPRIPDLIRMVPEFNGNPQNLPRWIESVEQKLEESKKFVSIDEYDRVLPIWLGIIRDKITEKANDALSTSYTPLEWNAIKSTLIEYFGDKSDLSSLVSRLTNLRQGSQSVLEFYQECKSLLAEINAKILINNSTPIEAKAVMGTYETLTINAFVDGLHDSMSDLTRSTRPQSLTDAYRVASEQEAAIRRRKERDSKQIKEAPKTKPLNANTGYQQNRPFAYAPAVHSRPPYFSQMPQQRPFTPSHSRPFQRFTPPGPNAPNHSNTQMAIKQEPRSQTGFRPFPRNRSTINMHEQFYDYYGYPPYPLPPAQHEYVQDDSHINEESTHQCASTEAAHSTLDYETVEQEANFSMASEPSQQT